ncbi:MAG: EFR1 family ferrodoxin [Bacillota bacterium]
MLDSRVKPMDIWVVYFSGSGNTRLVGEALARAIPVFAHGQGQDVAVRCNSVEELYTGALRGADALVAGFPVYAFHAPLTFRKFVERLPHGQGKPVFLYCTHGGAPFLALRVVARSFACQGYRVVGAKSIPMPDTIAVVMSKKDLGKAQSSDRRRSLQRQVEGLAALVVERLMDVRGVAAKVRLASPVEEWLTGALNVLGRGALSLALRRGFWVDSSCDACGVCVQSCPTGNIALAGGTVKFGSACEVCLRCVNVCPREAIQIWRFTAGKSRFRELWGADWDGQDSGSVGGNPQRQQADAGKGA